MSAKELAQLFLKDYFKDKEIVYPVNPFKILKDLNVNISFRDFSKAEGIYIPATNKDDLAIVGINLNRCIQRQRYTAAHELCHHLKDRNSNFVCKTGSKQAIERYAENFASEILELFLICFLLEKIYHLYSLLQKLKQNTKKRLSL